MQKIAGVACKLHRYLCLFEHDFLTTQYVRQLLRPWPELGVKLLVMGDVSGNLLNGTLNAIEP